MDPILKKVLSIMLFILAPFYTFGQDSIVKNTSDIFDQIILSDNDKAIFKEYTRQKVEEFQQFIVTIGNKDEAMELRNIAEREATKLFYKGAQIEISRIDDNGAVQIVARPVEKYLSRLKSLSYTQVVIKFYDIAYISDFLKGPDGRYYSTATIVQQFTGFMGDRVQYTDITKKEIEIVADMVEDSFFMEKRWKIFLGNIRALETTSSSAKLN